MTVLILRCEGEGNGSRVDTRITRDAGTGVKNSNGALAAAEKSTTISICTTRNTTSALGAAEEATRGFLELRQYKNDWIA